MTKAPSSTLTQPVLVQRVIPASPREVYDVVADPARHHEFDGSGTVRGTVETSRQGPLAVGDTFGMKMHLGLGYQSLNEVTAAEPGVRFAWQTHLPVSALRGWVAGRTWSFDLEPHDSGTLVRHIWDPTTEGRLTAPLIGFMAKTTRRNMDGSLRRLERLLA